MKRNLKKFAVALLFASAAITCSLTMWATTSEQLGVMAPTIGASYSVDGGNWPSGTLRPCVGEPRVVLVSPFADDYTCTNLGTVAVPFGWGGLTLKYDDPNTLLIGGNANTGNGRIYQIAVTRDANNHINGFSGGVTVYPTPNATTGQFNDGGVVFGPGNVLFVTRFPANELEQSKPGSAAPDKVTGLTALGIHSSVGSIGFVPAGFPGAGSMKIASFNSGDWYHCEFVPDGNGTFNITSASLRATLPNGVGPEGIAFVPPNSPVFPSNSVLIVDWQHGVLVTAPLDSNGDPIVANMQNVIEGMGPSEGGVIDPLTGDYLFSSAGVGGKIFRVSGFAAPSCTPEPWVFGHDYPFSASGAAVATDGSFAYVFGGYASGDVEHAEAYRYDLAANSWTALASMSTGPDFLCHSEYGGNGKIYVMGGVNNRAANRVYDIATNTWSLGAPMPVPASYHGHVSANGKIYVIGGAVGGAASSAVYAYDVAANTWSAPLASLPQAEYEMACGVINNKIYVAGGTTGSDMRTNLYIYDIATNSWTSGAPMLVGASFPGGAVVDGKLWVIGGGDPLQAISLDSTQIYDPGTNSWSNGPTLNTARLFANAVTLNVVGGQMPIIVGGYNSTSGSELSSVEAHPPGCSTSTPTPTPTATATATPTATATATTTPTATPTATATATATPTATATATPTATATATATPTPTATPTATATPSAAVTTNPATNVTSVSATLNGSVNPRGSTTTVYFQWGTTTSYGHTTAMQTQTGNTSRPITANISGLSANHLYHFRIVATNGGGTSFGTDRTFTTLSPPLVTTNPATNVASVSATLNGSVNPRGSTTTIHFQWGTTTSYEHTTPTQTKTGNTSLPITGNISGLSASHLYHFRIVATNGNGTSIGPDRTFTTLAATGPPVVTTNPASNVTTSSARLNGSLDPHGLTTTVYFKWGTTASYGHTTPAQTQTGNRYRNITANISGLTRHHTYHFRIVATNSAGTRTGRNITFNTP